MQIVAGIVLARVNDLGEAGDEFFQGRASTLNARLESSHASPSNACVQPPAPYAIPLPRACSGLVRAVGRSPARDLPSPARSRGEREVGRPDISGPRQDFRQLLAHRTDLQSARRWRGESVSHCESPQLGTGLNRPKPAATPVRRINEPKPSGSGMNQPLDPPRASVEEMKPAKTPDR